MVILIGGVSCTGKTLMAQRLLEKYSIPYVSIDHIKMGLIRGNKYCDFKPTDSDDEITEKLWPVVQGIIMTVIENEQNIMIEGCYLPPEHLGDFEPEYIKQIIALYIGFSKNYLDNHISAVIKHRSEIELKEFDEEYMNHNNFIKLHTQLKERCLLNNQRFFAIDDDYEKEMGIVYDWIDQQIQIRNG